MFISSFSALLCVFLLRQQRQRQEINLELVSHTSAPISISYSGLIELVPGLALCSLS